MTRSRRITRCALVMVVCTTWLCSIPALAQDGCANDESWGDCYLRLSGLNDATKATRQDLKAAADEVAAKQVDGKTTPDAGAGAARIDVEAKYEDVSDDPMRQSRFVATATYSQNLFDGNGLSLSIVYANRPEYRGEVDEEFSARAGLKFKIDKKK